MRRLFDRGSIEEGRVISDLRRIGCEVHDVDQGTDEQFRVVFAGGHVGGSLDGAVLGIPEAPKTWHVLEIKTHSLKSFRDVSRYGVQSSKPMHYAQMQIYMHGTGMDRALYVACNKDDDNLYTERVRLDKDFALSLIRKAELVVGATRPPSRIGECGSDECKYCPFSNLCHGNKAGYVITCDVNCRNCIFAGPVMSNGRWKCTFKEKDISYDEQLVGCKQHLFCPEMIGEYTEVRSGSEGPYVNYGSFQNGPGRGQYSSVELTRIPYKMMDDLGDVTRVKEAFDGKVV